MERNGGRKKGRTIDKGGHENRGGKKKKKHSLQTCDPCAL